MYWHIELILQAALLCILWRKPSPRWFSILIGVDFAASLLQLIPYRAGYRQIPMLIWYAGVVLAMPLVALALIEAGELVNGIYKLATSKDFLGVRFWHLRILASWVAGRMCILSLQMVIERQAFNAHVLLPPQFYWLNHALLTLDASAFLAWSCLFVL